MKARPGLLFLLGLLALFLVIRSLPKKSAGPARPGRPGEGELFQEEFGKKGGPTSASRTLEPPVIAMGFWETEGTGESFAIGRNLFRYAPPKPAAPPPRVPGSPGYARGGNPPSSGSPTAPPSRLDPGESKAVPPKPQPPPSPSSTSAPSGTSRGRLRCLRTGRRSTMCSRGRRSPNSSS